MPKQELRMRHAGSNDQGRTSCQDGIKTRPGVQGRGWGRGKELGLFTQASWAFCMQVMDLPISLLLLQTPDPRSPL